MSTTLLIMVILGVINGAVAIYKEREKKAKAAAEEAAQRGLSGSPLDLQERSDSVGTGSFGSSMGSSAALTPATPATPAAIMGAKLIDTRVADRKAKRKAAREAAREAARLAKFERARKISAPPPVTMRPSPLGAKPSNTAGAGSVGTGKRPQTGSGRPPQYPIGRPGQSTSSQKRPASKGTAPKGASSTAAAIAGAAIQARVDLLRANLEAKQRARTITAPRRGEWTAADIRRGFIMGVVLGAPRSQESWSAPVNG